MACDIANGRLEVCKDAVGGIDAIYFINYGIEAADITYDGTNTDVIDAVTGVTSLYKYELKGTNVFTQVVTSSRENGTSFVEQTLSVQLKKQDIATHKTVKLLSYGRPHIIIRDRNDKFYLAGLNWGMELTTGNVESGTAMGDFNGYSLSFVGQEKIFANLIDVASESALATAFDSATIVTV
jgi:hypothetical protein